MKKNKDLDASGLEKDVIQAIKKQAQATMQHQGANGKVQIPLIVGGAEFTMNSDLKKENDSKAEPCPLCDLSVCSQYVSQLQAICQEQRYSPGHLILVCDWETGVCCNCRCY